MDRYQIAILSRDKKKSFLFKNVRNINRACKLIEYCIENGATFIAEDVEPSLIETAVIKISKKTNSPIFLDSRERAYLFTISNSYKDVYYPGFWHQNKSVICYNCSDKIIPETLKSLVCVYDNKTKFEDKGQF